MKHINSDKSIRLNIAFKPPKNIIKRTVSLSQKFGKNNKAFFILDNIKFHPHITIYAPKYRKSDINKVLEGVEKIAKNTKNIEFQFQKISGDQGFIGVKFNYSPAIKKLYKKIIAKLNPLRKKDIKNKNQESSDYYYNFSPEQEKNIKKYGCSDSMALYSPHLTITRFKNELSANKIMSNIIWNISDFIINKIAVYEMGKHGTCKKLIKEFNLSSK